MTLLCRLGFHQWELISREVMRDEAQGKVRVQWYVCGRHCGAIRQRAKVKTP